MPGTLVNGSFEGTWDGVSMGTSLGEIISATGMGTWAASPQ
jgi:hypothetical protein